MTSGRGFAICAATPQADGNEAPPLLRGSHSASRNRCRAADVRRRLGRRRWIRVWYLPLGLAAAATFCD